MKCLQRKNLKIGLKAYIHFLGNPCLFNSRKEYMNLQSGLKFHNLNCLLHHVEKKPKVIKLLTNHWYIFYMSCQYVSNKSLHGDN